MGKAVMGEAGCTRCCEMPGVGLSSLLVALRAGSAQWVCPQLACPLNRQVCWAFPSLENSLDLPTCVLPQGENWVFQA